MRFRSLAGSVLLTMLCFVPPVSLAATSAGLSLAITKAEPQQSNVVIEFQITNNTKTRVYIEYGRAVQSATAFLDSGAQLSTPSSVAGIEVCNSGLIGACSTNNLDIFSYLEPGESLAFNIQYFDPRAINSNDRVSFSVPLFVKYTKIDGNPDVPDNGRPVRFNFSHVPLNGRLPN